MASRKDYYDILGIGRGASEEEIEKAYRRLTRTYQVSQPSANKIAEYRFREIAEAYATLSNKERKEKYDRLGPENSAGDFFGDYGFEEEENFDLEGFEDFFESHFLGQQKAAPRPSQRGKDIFHSLEIEFLEAIQGVEKKVEILREIPCSDCAGRGVEPSSPLNLCPNCGGAGRLQMGLPPQASSRICSRCHGGGTIQTEACSSCSGTGRRLGREVVSISLPAGVGDRCRIYLKGMGHASGNGGPRGDFVAQVEVKKHPYFQRKGDDLYLEVPLMIWEAMLGSELEVPTLEGLIPITVPPGVQGGDQMRLRGKGICYLEGNGRGDQVIFFKIVVPKKLDEKSRAMLRELSLRNHENPRSHCGWHLKP